MTGSHLGHLLFLLTSKKESCSTGFPFHVFRHLIYPVSLIQESALSQRSSDLCF